MLPLKCRGSPIVGLSDLVKKLPCKGIINARRNFCRQQVRIFHGKQEHIKNINFRNRDENRSHPNALFVVGSRQKLKMKTRNTRAFSYHSKISSTQVPFFSCLDHGV